VTKPTLFGYGLTTKAIAKKLGGGCRFFDDKATEPRKDADNNEILPSAMFDPSQSSCEVTTPSLRPDNPLIKQAKNLLSEYDYILGDCPDSAPFTIWISGTNGKTTTTQMLTLLLESRGALSGGNIGTPLAQLDTNAPIWVLESSSYTLHHTSKASPNIYLLLPITPDHLDWHGTAEQYEADKLKPLTTMREGELALVPKGLHLPQTDAWVVEYDDNAFLEEFFAIDSSLLRYRAAFLQDALLSLAVTKVLFQEADYELLNSFKLDHHRQEEIRDRRDRLWVNDSKATNVDATIQAIHTYSQHKIHLIIGGDDKGVDLAPLMDMIAKESIHLYTVGSNNDKLVSMAKSREIPHTSCQDIQNAITQIDNNLLADEIALLSPAASSLDQFASYAKRGELFMKLVSELREPLTIGDTHNASSFYLG